MAALGAGGRAGPAAPRGAPGTAPPAAGTPRGPLTQPGAGDRAKGVPREKRRQLRARSPGSALGARGWRDSIAFGTGACRWWGEELGKLNRCGVAGIRQMLSKLRISQDWRGFCVSLGNLDSHFSQQLKGLPSVKYQNEHETKLLIPMASSGIY